MSRKYRNAAASQDKAKQRKTKEEEARIEAAVAEALECSERRHRNEMESKERRLRIFAIAAASIPLLLLALSLVDGHVWILDQPYPWSMLFALILIAETISLLYVPVLIVDWQHSDKSDLAVGALFGGVVVLTAAVGALSMALGLDGKTTSAVFGAALLVQAMVYLLTRYFYNDL